MSTHYNTLLEKVHELNDLQKAIALLHWDREAIMPKAGMAERVQQMTTLTRLAHRMGTSDEFGALIERAAEEVADSDDESTEKRLVAEVKWQYEQARKLSPELVKRRAEVTGKASGAWQEARAKADFALFEPYLEQTIDIARESAEQYGYDQQPYDALLNLFERGMTTDTVRKTFAAVSDATVPLLQAIVSDGKQIDDSVLHQAFAVESQKAVARTIATAVGYDFERGYLGTVVHPFATSFSRNDCRITSRWYPDFLNPGLFGTLHESGHAIYEQGTDAAFSRTPLARGTSSGIHESQSRLFENLIGRSYGFWQANYSALQAAFPAQLGSVTCDQFYLAINKVQPSFIRVEADELTYNLHIILRFELEIALLNGDLQAHDVPTAWNDKMQQLLGITPPSDAQGCLQDMHWSAAMFGYFPTYALGNLYAVQLYDAALAQLPALKSELEYGEIGGLFSWLHENVHRHGKKYTPDELVTRATGQSLTHEPFVAYVTKKFSQIYGL
ncbi:MAG: carboxypeptidase M32 [Anaerolineae bacterium]|nr:carboxypeptidase M32 [Anaerolineae bacterium]